MSSAARGEVRTARRIATTQEEEPWRAVGMQVMGVAGAKRSIWFTHEDVAN